MSSLDLFSTSQTSLRKRKVKNDRKDKQTYDECLNNAPYFAYQIEGKRWGVVQGCCNDWNCPRCGQQRAREEYGRIVSGARQLAKTHELFFLTITCRGKELSHEDAENGYLGWTNTLLTRLRTSAKRASVAWYYASVTERQKRQHPHTHFITTYCPHDAIPIEKGAPKYFYTTGETYTAKHNTLQTEYVERACYECGLGWQYDLSRVESVEAGSRYVSKYLFKETIFSDKWPKGWRRVRYSQNWPKLPEVKGDAFILLSNFDWYKLGTLAVTVSTKDNGAKEFAKQKLSHMDVIVV